MLLRPGNAGSNTFTDHKEVLAAALRQVPARFRRKVLVRVDGAGASHELMKHLLSLSSPRQNVLFTCGWMITAADEDAIRQRPRGRVEARHRPGRQRRGGQGRRGDHGPDEPRRELARRAALDRPPGEAVPPPHEQPDGLREEDRLEVLHHLHEHPRRRDRRRPGQPPPAVHRRPSTASTPSSRPAASAPPRPWACGTCPRRPGRSTPAGSSPRTSPPTWPPGPASSACHDDADLREADPDTLRYRIWHIPARLARHARQRILEDQPRLALEGRVPHLLAAALRPASTRLTSTNHPSDTEGGPPRRGRSRCAPGHTGHHRAPPAPGQTDTTPENRHQHNQ